MSLQKVMVDNIGHPLSPQLLQVFLMTLPIFLRLLCSAKPFYYCKALTYYTFYVCASGRPKSNCDLVLASIAYSILRNKHWGTLINFWNFFQGLRSLLERVMHIFFSKYPLFYALGDAYFKGYA